MKCCTVILIILSTIWINFGILAQPKTSSDTGLFNLKEGDWFETKFIIPNGSKDILAFKEIVNQLMIELHLRFRLSRQFETGNQLYDVIAERTIVKGLKGQDMWMGYDSYYPPYQEEKKHETKKITFRLEITPHGEILRYEFDPNELLYEITAREISPKVEPNVETTSTISVGPDVFKTCSQLITMWPKKINQIIETTKYKTGYDLTIRKLKEREYNEFRQGLFLINDSNSVNITFCKKTRVPVQIKNKFQLTKASFKVPENTAISGNIRDMPNKTGEITLVGHQSQNTFNKILFKSGSDGSFNCPIFLSEPAHLLIKIDNQSLTTFLQPGDTLKISKIGKYKEPIYIGDRISHVPPKESEQQNNIHNFAGNATHNTMLANEIGPWISYEPSLKDIKELTSFRLNVTKEVEKIFTAYSGKASATCISYFRTEWNYFLAGCKLHFMAITDTYRWVNGKLQHFPGIKVKDVPVDFFIEVDTLPLLLNSFKWSASYNNFIPLVQRSKHSRLAKAAAISTLSNFNMDWHFSVVSLKGYPLYFVLSELLDNELRNTVASVEKVLPYYQDFINNCSDPEMKRPIQLLHETAMNFKIGNIFPLQSIQTKSLTFNLKQHEGVPLCIAILPELSKSSDYKMLIDKFTSAKMQFIFIHASRNNNILPDSSLSAKPNVIFLKMSEQKIKETFLNPSRIFVLDKWFRIVGDHLDDNDSKVTEALKETLGETLKEAINAKRFSSEEWNSFIRILGWSIGSFLITLFVSMIIYRSRIKSLKQREVTKRQIKELEIKAIRSQMNPHFIFNALNSIQSLINAEQFKQANIYLAKFASLSRRVLNNSEKAFIPLADELEAVQLYCQLEQLRFDFTVEISISPEVNTNLIEIPGMLIQPLTENAIVHGLAPKGNKGWLHIKVSKDNGNLCIRVIDNGIGLSSRQADRLNQKGFGLKLAEERLNILNSNKNQSKLVINKNIAEESGTEAMLIIPID
jgi:two-component sensor histidine kinase